MMEKPHIEKLEAGHPDTQSVDVVAENIRALKALFPELVTEGPNGAAINVDVLKALVGDQTVTDADEKYGLNWHGKRRARRIALTPSTGTLRPCPEESVDWDTTQNLMIEGDNLEVLKLLQKSYSRRIKAIYIDPPYNTGRNIIYPNDYQDGISAYLELTGQAKGSSKLTSNPETGGRFHSNWISMIYPRLLVAKNLLRPDGVLFCTIDENEHATLSVIIKEIFAEGVYEHAYVSIVHNPRGQQGTNISYVHENAIIVYSADKVKYLADVMKDAVDSRNLRDSGTESNRTDARNCFYPFIVKDMTIESIGNVPDDCCHPEAANVVRPDGSIEVWPMTDDGDEKKWRYARDSVLKIMDKLEPKNGRKSIQIIFHKNSGTMRSVWQNARYDSSEYGTKLVDGLLDGAGFTFPKSLWAVYDAIKLMTESDPDAIVLDFFAGSGTTGHAMMELNKDDGGSRRFILVQLPEPLEQDNPEQEAAMRFCRSLGYANNIAELTKERIRRAGRKIRDENPMFAGDLGFRVFKLDSTNIREWEPRREDLAGSVQYAIDHLKPGRTEQDILYEVLLKLGLDLCVKIETREVAGAAPDARHTIHAIGGGTLLACLSPQITRDDVEKVGLTIAAWRAELAPAGDVTCIFRDSAFADDVSKTNMAAILEQNGVAKVRSL